ncbi:hypothetical protein HYT57_03760 [Candidatus Woesearchaeota archaeon]|nr:hypothetical protein [Candidatus Woesearchaeota archaeon]
MKKGQFHESLIVILIFTIIFGIALFGIYRYNLSSIQDIQIELEESKSLALLSQLPVSPYLQYSELSDEKEMIDTLKLLNLKLDNLGFRTIEIKQVYPNVGNLECNEENYPNCSTYIIYNVVKNSQDKKITSIPVSLYFPLTKESKIGNLVITTYG